MVSFVQHAQEKILKNISYSNRAPLVKSNQKYILKKLVLHIMPHFLTVIFTSVIYNIDFFLIILNYFTWIKLYKNNVEERKKGYQEIE